MRDSRADFRARLDYFGARYYGSALGRFTSPDEPLVDQDPSSPQSWNLYSYVRNNPLRSIDPTGRECVQTNNGPADDGTGGGCEAAGVSSSGKIVPQVFDVDDKGNTSTEISGVFWSVGPNGLQGPIGERSLRDDTANLASQLVPAAKGLAAGGLIAGVLSGGSRSLTERIALALGAKILGGTSEVTIELSTGALVTLSAESVGTNLTVDISGAVAFGSTGNLFALRQGLMAAARAEGADTLTIVASKVGNQQLQSMLTKAGFQSLGTTTFQGQAVGAFAKTFGVR